MKHTDAIIPDAELAWYLRDKITEKPSYGYSTEKESSIVSDWLKRMADEARNRKSSNQSAGRGLKK
jgi:hypothetical protein